MPKPLESRRKIWAKLALIVVSFLLTLAIGEVALQGYYRWTEQSWLWDYNAFHITYVQEVSDRRRYALRPGFSDNRIGVTINANGFRSPESLADPAPETPVIAVVGDSKAFGAGVRDDESYAYQLGRLLTDRPTPVAVVNGGVPSYNTRQAIDRFSIDILPRYNVKLVVFEAPFNDVALLSHYGDDWDTDKTWADLRFGDFAAPLPFSQRSAIVYYAARAWKRSNSISPSERSKSVLHQKVRGSSMISAVRSELDGLIRECEAKSIPIIFLPIDPFYYQTQNKERNGSLPLWNRNGVYADVWDENVRGYDDLLIELSKNHSSVHFLDTRQIFDELDRGELFTDAIHYSAKGNRLVAEGLEEMIKKDGFQLK